jgi:hypothetical protein
LKSAANSILHSAQCELSEEMQLAGGEWIALHDSQEGIPELKWGSNRFWPFLVIDPRPDPHPKEQDPEEYIIVHQAITIERLKELIMQGRLMLPSVQTAWMAMERLKSMGLL